MQAMFSIWAVQAQSASKVYGLWEPIQTFNFQAFCDHNHQNRTVSYCLHKMVEAGNLNIGQTVEIYTAFFFFFSILQSKFFALTLHKVEVNVRHLCNAVDIA